MDHLPKKLIRIKDRDSSVMLNNYKWLNVGRRSFFKCGKGQRERVRSRCPSKGVGMAQLITRRLGRTGRQVTTLGLGGQASIQWTAEGVDPIAIIEKAYHLGINYMDTSNIYGPSQHNFGEAFRRLGLSPSAGNYDPAAREQIFIASKTHIRTARRPEGKLFRTDYSEGMSDEFGVSTAVDDVHRSLSLLFGDGRGAYPEGAYLDSIQFHNINTMDEVDMLFEGFDDPSPHRPWLGSLAAMLDLREGTNRTGCNPKKGN